MVSRIYCGKEGRACKSTDNVKRSAQRSGKTRDLILYRNAGIGQIRIGGGITGSERTRQPQDRLVDVKRFTGSKLIVTLAVADDEPEVRTGFLSFDCSVSDAVIGVRVVIRVSPPALGDCAAKIQDE